MLNQNKHRQILIRILKDIYDDHELAQALGFKGGTMAYLFYDLPRFSVDLDFDLIDNDNTEIKNELSNKVKIEKLQKVREKIKKILEKYGGIRQDDNKRYSLFFLLSYEIGAHNIKIDINKRNFGSLYEVKSYLGIDMQVMQSEYMVAHKMVAMYERMDEATRDIFDVHYFLSKHFEFNVQIIKDRTGLEYIDFIKVCVEKLQSIQSNKLLNGIGELIDEKQKFWVKNKMVEDTILLLKLSQAGLDI